MTALERLDAAIQALAAKWGVRPTLAETILRDTGFHARFAGKGMEAITKLEEMVGGETK